MGLLDIFKKRSKIDTKSSTKLKESLNSENDSNLLKKNFKDQFILAEEKNQKRMIASAMSIFGYENAIVEQKEVAQLINNVISKYTTKTLLALDDIYRESYYIYTVYNRKENWNYLLVCKNIINICENKEDKIRLLILCTMDCNGYVRQEGINNLSNYEYSLPFLLLRLNDWVDEVKEAAYVAAKKRIYEADLKELTYSLPVLYKVEKSYRRKEEAISEISKSIGEIIAKKHKQFDYSAFINYEQFAKNAFYKFIYNNNIYSKQHLQDLLSLTTGKYDSMMLINTIIHHFGITKEEFFRYKSSKNAFIRKNAITRWISDHGLWEGAEESLMDKSASIRHLIQFYLSRDKYNITQYYLRHLQTDNNKVAIKGLGETSGKDVVEYLIPFLDSDDINLIQITLNSIGKILRDEGKEYYSRFLDCQYTPLVREAYQQSLKWNVYYDEKYLQDLYFKTDDNKKGLYYLLLIFKKPHWKCLPFYLSLYGRIPDEQQNILGRVIYRRPMYSKVSDDLKSEIFRAIEDNITYLPDSLITNIQFDMEHL